MKMHKFAWLTALALAAWPWQHGTGQIRNDSPPADAVETLPPFRGEVYDGKKAIAKISLYVNKKDLSVFGTVSSKGDSSSIQAGKDGELFISAFPLYDPDRRADQQEAPRATLQFDESGKPTANARKLSGTIKTEKGQTFKFEARALVLPEPGR
jgi:hypothetical protein